MSKLAYPFVFGGYLPDIVGQSDGVLAAAGAAENFWGSDPKVFMREALRESMLAVGLSSPNPAVGCVVVKDQKIIARGHTQSPGNNHAERQAHASLVGSGIGDILANGGWPEGAEVYVTLEPCCVHGRTPPCTDLFAGARDTRLFVGLKDPNLLVNGKGIEMLRAQGLSVDVGLLGTEIAATLLPFAHAQSSKAVGSQGVARCRRPFVGLKWAQSVDGRLADAAGGSQWLTGSTAKLYTHWLRQKYDAIAVGWATFVSDRPQLNVRHVPGGVAPRDPVRIIFDPRDHFGKMEDEARCVTFSGSSASPLGPWIVIGPVAAQSGLKQRVMAQDPTLTPVVAQDGSVLAHWVRFATDDPAQLIQSALSWLVTSEAQRVCGRAIQSVVVEGGPKIQNLFMNGGLFDIVHAWISPLWLGNNPNGVLGLSDPSLAAAPRLELLQAIPVGDDVMCEWRRR